MGNTYTFVFFTLSKFSAAQLGVSPFILGSEYFPTEVRSFVVAAVVGVGRIGACVGIACSQYVFDLNPRLDLLVTQILAVVVGICLSALKKETAGTQIE